MALTVNITKSNFMVSDGDNILNKCIYKHFMIFLSKITFLWTNLARDSE